jgi:hypothetical protein
MTDIKEIININSVCTGAYPCQHYVLYKTKDGNKKQKTIFMQDIYKLCKNLNYKLPEHIENEYNFWKNKENLSFFNEKFNVKDNEEKQNKENKENINCILL